VNIYLLGDVRINSICLYKQIYVREMLIQTGVLIHTADVGAAILHSVDVTWKKGETQRPAGWSEKGCCWRHVSWIGHVYFLWRRTDGGGEFWEKIAAGLGATLGIFS
jgi:hypothetical protein